MKNAKYWAPRFRMLEQKVYTHSRELYQILEAEYKKATTRINRDIESWYAHFAKNNNMTLLDAKKILDINELFEFKMTLSNYFKVIKSGDFSKEWLKQLDNYNTKVRITRLEYIQIQIQQYIEELFGNELDLVSKFERKIYQDEYYKTAFEVQRGMNIGWQFDRLSEKELDKVILKPWTADGSNFSSRIWHTKSKLVETLKTELIQMLIRGDSPETAIRSLQRFSKTMDRSLKNAGRLVMTESAYFASAAERDSYQELGIEKYQILATLDEHTCSTCQSLDGEILPMNEYRPGATAPPFHPNCRTTTMPYIEEGYGKRIARDKAGKTMYVDANMKYGEWKRQFLK